MSEKAHGLFRLKNGFSLVLASSSPRRKDLLSSLGLPFSIFTANEGEPKPEANEDPASFTRRAAFFKGHTCLNVISEAENAIVIAADTVVALDKQILGKPATHQLAYEMLSLLNGRIHQVHTSVYFGVPASRGYEEFCQEECSLVEFGDWPDCLLRAYAATPEPMDKAGAYAAQGYGSFLVRAIEGSWTNVVGLPLQKVIAQLFPAYIELKD